MDSITSVVVSGAASSIGTGGLVLLVFKNYLRKMVKAPEAIDVLQRDRDDLMVRMTKLEEKLQVVGDRQTSSHMEYVSNLQGIKDSISALHLEFQNTVSTERQHTNDAMVSIAASVADVVSRLAYIEGAFNLNGKG